MQNYIIEEQLTKENGEKHTKHYAKGNLLGKGSEIECYELIDLETKKISAAKIFPKARIKKTKLKEKIRTELKIQTRLNHPNIIKFEHFFEDSENVYILLELCINKNLNELLRRRKRLTELEAQYYLLQLITGLKYLHNLKIIHRDLRLESLFLNEKLELKIGDFAYATKIEFDGERKTSVCGVPNYKAPEMISGSHSYEADIWSVGVILYTILIGKPPFHTDNSQTTYSKIKGGIYDIPESADISDACKELMRHILVVDYANRLTLDQILKSDFFNQGYPIPKLMGLSTLASPPCIPRVTRKHKTQIKSEKITQEQFKANIKMQGNVFTGFGSEGDVYVKK